MDNSESDNGLVRQGKNSDRRKEAFKLFCQVGNKAAVARKLGVSSAIVYSWARADGWEDHREKIRDQLKIQLQFLRTASDNKVVQLLSADIAFLEYLQETVAEKIITQAIEPKTWRDVIMTQKFIFECKEKIIGSLRDDPPLGATSPNGQHPKEGENSSDDADNDKRCLEGAITPKAGGDGS